MSGHDGITLPAFDGPAAFLLPGRPRVERPVYNQ